MVVSFLGEAPKDCAPELRTWDSLSLDRAQTLSGLQSRVEKYFKFSELMGKTHQRCGDKGMYFNEANLNEVDKPGESCES